MEEQAQLEAIVVTAHVEKKSKDGAIIPTESGEEKFYVVNTGGVINRAMTTTNVACGGRVSVDIGWPGPLPNGSAGAHTHGPKHDSTPGSGDNIAARGSTTKAAFVMTSKNAFMVRAFGDGTYAANVISGPSLSGNQRAALIGYMQGWEGAVVNDASITDK